jgi:hypothetical protein
MMKRLICKATKIVGLIWLSAGACLAFDGATGDELNQALEEIKSTAQLIEEATAAAEVVQGQLQTQAEALAAEIVLERRRRRVDTFQQALQVGRIRYDLLALRQVTGYLTQLVHRISYLRTAASTLNVYRDQVRDDRLMLRVLNDVDSSDLLRRVREAVCEYRRRCAAAYLTVQTATASRELEILWTDMVKSH